MSKNKNPLKKKAQEAVYHDEFSYVQSIPPVPNKKDPDTEFIPQPPCANPNESSLNHNQNISGGNESINEILKNLPAGVYLKLYRPSRVMPASQSAPWEFKEKIQREVFEKWDDFETEIIKIVRDGTRLRPGAYGSGLYRIVFFQDDRSKKLPPIDFMIDAGESEKVLQEKVDYEHLQAQVTQMVSLVGMINGLRTPVDPAVQIAQIQSEAATLSALFTMSNEFIKTQMNAKQNPAVDPLTIQQGMMFDILKAALNREPEKDTSFERFISMLDKIKIFEKREDPLDLMIKIKQSGILPEPDKRDPLEKDLALMEKLLPFVEMFSENGSGNPTVSPWAPVLTELLPHVGKLAENVTDLWKSSLETKKLENALKVNTKPANPQPRQATPPQKPLPAGQRPDPPGLHSVDNFDIGPQMMNFPSSGSHTGIAQKAGLIGECSQCRRAYQYNSKEEYLADQSCPTCGWHRVILAGI